MGTVKAGISELAECIESIRTQTRALKFGGVGGSDYKGVFETADQAKRFGELVLKTIGKNVAQDNSAKVVSKAIDGGYLVPDDIANRIIQKLGQYGVFRKNTTVLQLNTASTIVPRITTDLVVYVPGEGAAITASDVSFDAVTLIPKKWACLAAFSTELAEDAVTGIGEIIGMSIVRSMAKREDEAAFLGDGTSQYFNEVGICGALRAVDAAIANIKGLIVGSGNAYSELTLTDFRKVVAILPEDADAGAKWYMSKKFYNNVVWPLAEAAGIANLLDILSDRKERFLFGYPVEFISCMPSVEDNSQICAILGDLQLGSYLGERRYLTIEQSREAFFTSDQIGIKGTQRIDVNVFGVGDTTEAGSIVGLITAAA